MRIVAGKYGGRRLAAPAGRDTRPTADRTREAVFNVLSHGLGVDFEGARVVDVFAGSGALGLEALSRGAAHASFVERDRKAAAALRENIEALGAEAGTTVLTVDARRMPAPGGGLCRIAFLDAPYKAGLSEPALERLKETWLAPGAVCVVEVGADEDFAAPDGFTALDERRYGAARIVFLERRD